MHIIVDLMYTYFNTFKNILPFCTCKYVSPFILHIRSWKQCTIDCLSYSEVTLQTQVFHVHVICNIHIIVDLMYTYFNTFKNILPFCTCKYVSPFILHIRSWKQCTIDCLSYSEVTLQTQVFHVHVICNIHIIVDLMYTYFNTFKNILPFCTCKVFVAVHCTYQKLKAMHYRLFNLFRSTLQTQIF